MSRCITSIVMTTVFLTNAASLEAQSRIGPPPRQPSVSPYLNLLRRPNNGGGGLGFNYYQRYLPQRRALEADRTLTNSLNRVQRQQQTLQRQIDTGLAPTGHQTSFMNLGSYYPQYQR